MWVLRWLMKQSTFLKITSSTFLIFFLMAQKSYATSSSVHVSTSGDDVHTTVHSEVNATNSTITNSSSSKTHIRIENNGVVKEYNSDQPGDVTITSDDGKSSVHVNNTSDGSQVKPTDEQMKKAITDAKAKLNKAKKHMEEKINEQKMAVNAQKRAAEAKKSLIQKIFDSLKSFFSFHRNA